MPVDHVKENRFAIITIMLKQIAAGFREKWPEYHIKAHPMRYRVGCARLVIREKNILVIFDVCIGSPPQLWQNPKKEDPNEYTASVQITIGNKVTKKKTPKPWSFTLDDPNSVIKFETWAIKIAQSWINVNTSEQQEQRVVDIDRSATL